VPEGTKTHGKNEGAEKFEEKHGVFDIFTPPNHLDKL